VLKCALKRESCSGFLNKRKDSKIVQTFQERLSSSTLPELVNISKELMSKQIVAFVCWMISFGLVMLSTQDFFPLSINKAIYVSGLVCIFFTAASIGKSMARNSQFRAELRKRKIRK
jgi:hypothetical protein